MVGSNNVLGSTAALLRAPACPASQKTTNNRSQDAIEWCNMEPSASCSTAALLPAPACPARHEDTTDMQMRCCSTNVKRLKVALLRCCTPQHTLEDKMKANKGMQVKW
jgi:hypothetical protein